jgi:hypothetical protein
VDALKGGYVSHAFFLLGPLRLRWIVPFMLIGNDPQRGQRLVSRRRLILFLPHFGQEARKRRGCRGTSTPVIPQRASTTPVIR